MDKHRCNGGGRGASGQAQQELVARTTASFQRTQLKEMFS